jgi:hypothetical protein
MNQVFRFTGLVRCGEYTIQKKWKSVVRQSVNQGTEAVERCLSSEKVAQRGLCLGTFAGM